MASLNVSSKIPVSTLFTNIAIETRSFEVYNSIDTLLGGLEARGFHSLILLSLYKLCLDDRQMTEVTISTYFRAEALACPTQRGLSRVT
jgi:hypothetical protein